TLREDESTPLVPAALPAAQAEAVGIGRLGQLQGIGPDLVAGVWRLEGRRLEKVRAVIEVEDDILDGQVILLAVRALVELDDMVEQICFAGPAVNAVTDGLQRPHFDQSRLGE